MSVQNVAQLTYGSTIEWVGGVPFNGYVLLLMAMPGATAYNSIFLRDCQPKTEVPRRVKIAIREGVYDTSAKIWRTDSLVPSTVKYCTFFYDDADRLIVAGPGLQTVTSDPFTLTPPTLTDPTAAVACPTPEAVPDPATVIAYYAAPTREDVAGTKNGVNDAFTVSTAGSLVVIIWNGTILDKDVGYTQSGVNITMAVGYIPNSGDSLEALIWG